MTALAALYQTIYQQLNGDAIWGDRLYPDIVPPDVTRPYVTWFVAGGGRDTERVKNDHRLVITVKCVSEDLSTAFDGGERIAQLLADHGAQEPSPLPTVSGWTITTITLDNVVHITEMFANVNPIYHHGYNVIVHMAEE